MGQLTDGLKNSWPVSMRRQTVSPLNTELAEDPGGQVCGGAGAAGVARGTTVMQFGTPAALTDCSVPLGHSAQTVEGTVKQMARSMRRIAAP